MADRDPFWDALKAHKKEKFAADRASFKAQAEAGDDGKWTKHTEFHWSRTVAGHRLDYWPSRRKYQYLGKVRRGDVLKVIREIEERGKC